MYCRVARNRSFDALVEKKALNSPDVNVRRPRRRPGQCGSKQLPAACALKHTHMHSHINHIDDNHFAFPDQLDSLMKRVLNWKWNNTWQVNNALSYLSPEAQCPNTYTHLTVDTDCMDQDRQLGRHAPVTDTRVCKPNADEQQ